jgi:hypothetical protein
LFTGASCIVFQGNQLGTEAKQSFWKVAKQRLTEMNINRYLQAEKEVRSEWSYFCFDNECAR